MVGPWLGSRASIGGLPVQLRDPLGRELLCDAVMGVHLILRLLTATTMRRLDHRPLTAAHRPLTGPITNAQPPSAARFARRLPVPEMT
jgi:hypothetical protein